MHACMTFANSSVQKLRYPLSCSDATYTSPHTLATHTPVRFRLTMIRPKTNSSLTIVVHPPCMISYDCECSQFVLCINTVHIVELPAFRRTTNIFASDVAPKDPRVTHMQQYCLALRCVPSLGQVIRTNAKRDL